MNVGKSKVKLYSQNVKVGRMDVRLNDEALKEVDGFK